MLMPIPLLLMVGSISLIDARKADRFGKGADNREEFRKLSSDEVRSAIHLSEGALLDRDGCLKRSMCVLGMIHPDETPRMSIAAGAGHLMNVLHKLIDMAEITGIPEDLTNTRQVVASHDLGKSFGDRSLCETLFPCHKGAIELARGAVAVRSNREGDAIAPAPTGDSSDMIELPPQPPKEVLKPEDAPKLASCSVSESICPGIGVGCDVCGIISPETCKDTCFYSGIYCVVGDVVCDHFAPQEGETTEGGNEESTTSSTPRDGTE